MIISFLKTKQDASREVDQTVPNECDNKFLKVLKSGKWIGTIQQ